MSIENKNNFYQNNNDGGIGVIDKVTIKRQELINQGKLDSQKFSKVLREIRDSQNIIISGILGEYKDSDIKGDYHEIEIDLTQKNKQIIISILEQIGIIYAYENEDNQEKTVHGIEILSLDNKETDNYTLKIIIKRRNYILPFYIESIKIDKNF